MQTEEHDDDGPILRGWIALLLIVIGMVAVLLWQPRPSVPTQKVFLEKR